MSEKLRSFTMYNSPFEEFELILSWHSYQRLGEDAQEYNLIFEQAEKILPKNTGVVPVLLDYLGANGFSVDHRFFYLKLDLTQKTYEIQRILGSINAQELFEYCDRLQYDNKMQLSQSVVERFTKSIDEVFAENTKIFG